MIRHLEDGLLRSDCLGGTHVHEILAAQRVGVGGRVHTLGDCFLASGIVGVLNLGSGGKATGKHQRSRQQDEAFHEQPSFAARDAQLFVWERNQLAQLRRGSSEDGYEVIRGQASLSA